MGRDIYRIVSMDEVKDWIKSSVIKSFDDIKNMEIGGLRIGVDFEPTGQMMGNLFHLLIPKHMEKESNGFFRAGSGKLDKDIICTVNDDFNMEIKTSSSKNGVYGNRSYSKSTDGKDKSSFYIVVNYDNITFDCEGGVISIRFGYINAKDWFPQDSDTGQQASLNRSVKLEAIYSI